MRRLTRCTFARFLGIEGESVELPSGDIQDLDIPVGAWGVEIFSHYAMRNGPGLEGLIGDVSGQCEVCRYIFGEELVNPADGGKPYAITPDGNKELQPGDIFVPAFRVPAPA